MAYDSGATSQNDVWSQCKGCVFVAMFGDREWHGCSRCEVFDSKPYEYSTDLVTGEVGEKCPYYSDSWDDEEEDEEDS